jgi:putative ABC transport system substrate-binding protein
MSYRARWAWTTACAAVLVTVTSQSAGAPPPNQAEPPYRISMVLPREEQNIEAGFRDYLAKRKLPVRIDVLRFSGKAEDGPALVRQLRESKPQLIYTWGTGTTLAVAGPYDAPAGKFIQDIPVVFTEVTDPLGSHLLRQLDPPGRNVTGVSHVAPLPAQLNAIRGYRPFKRLGYIVNPKESNTQLVADALGKLAKEQGFELVQETVPLDATGNPDPHALKDVIDKIAARKVDFLYIGPSTFLAFTHRDQVTELALQAKLPTFCATESIVRKARCMFGLFSHGSNVGRFAAHKAAQVLAEGKRVDTIPAETLQRFSLLINMPTVKALDLYPPLALLNVAEVIQ